MEYGLQLCSVRDAMAADAKGTLKTVAEIGYSAVEFAGFYGHSAKEMARYTDRAGLRISGAHIPYTDLLPDAIEKTLAYHRELGNTRLIIPIYDASTPEKLEAFVRSMKEWQERLGEAGFTLGYHNHHTAFLPVGGEGLRAFDELWNRTDIFFQIDTYWAYVAGEDPVALLREKKDRIPVIHLKDGDLLHRGYSLGLGTAPVRAIHDTAVSLGMEIVVESETQNPTGPEEVARCMAYLKSLVK